MTASGTSEDRHTLPLALVGSTASGKTDAAVRVAQTLGAEIVSVDSATVYRGMDVGTAKPDQAERAEVPHHLLDLVEPGEPFSVAQFQQLGRAAISEITKHGAVPLLVGGSGLYYRALVDELEFPGTSPSIRGSLETEARVLGSDEIFRRLAAIDVEAARRMDPRNVRRTVRALEVMALTGRPFSSFSSAWDRYPPGAVRAAGVMLPRSILHRRIEERAARMMSGLVNETRRLVERGHEPFIIASQTIGYAESVAYLDGSMTEDEALTTFIRRTKTLARRQLAWFRRDPRIRWFTAGAEGAASLVDELIAYFAGRPVTTATATAATP
ncbi:MAG TPA: tRNA (adenosine(37)-N6)-dimethylallyltransferase MiaA [Actinomycetota bacterium]